MIASISSVGYSYRCMKKRDMKSFTIDIDGELMKFESLIGDIEGVAAETKQLWKLIYKNAVADREAAAELFSDLRAIVLDNENDQLAASSQRSAAHAMHGMTLSKYLERLHRSNEQLMKLSELVSEAREREEQIDTESMFEEIKNSK